MDDDRNLVERIKRGDGEAFGVLYDRTRRWLLDCVIRPRVGATAAEDVLAETYRTALAKIADFEWRGVSLLHWLAAIAKNKSLERVRAERRDSAVLDPWPELFDVPDQAPTAEAEMIRVETLAHVQKRVGRTLAELAPRYAEALRLRTIEDRPRHECAQRLGVSTATFDVVFYRATRAFARAWSRE